MNKTLPPLPFDNVALFFDFDGTLVELQPTPEAVIVDDELRTVLKSLNNEVNQALALISGRSLDSLDHLLAMPTVNVSGSHGMQFRCGQSGDVFLHPDTISLPETLLHDCQRFCHQHDLLLEDKPLTVAIHYRNKPDMENQVEAYLQQLTERFSSLKLSIQAGKSIRELKPSGINKASALDYFTSKDAFQDRTPWYFGDDVTDEDAFTWINERNGVSVKIGDGESNAQYLLDSPQEVIAFLKDRLAVRDNQ
ncbi:trehalose-phosphatase [Vibrio palustris]|uniref:Trehalose 6-phosphate phosphatase n=1 Tax=Vibrio palustris TaxID=1918946 RepID=A0A1R4B2D4_9VIBR|nr:trehalose-phosphatase [Vibrio palustris]SJL83080.1 Trehalose-6-phosphate phosphatase [Vibrio palustris]